MNYSVKCTFQVYKLKKKKNVLNTFRQIENVKYQIGILLLAFLENSL